MCICSFPGFRIVGTVQRFPRHFLSTFHDICLFFVLAVHVILMARFISNEKKSNNKLAADGKTIHLLAEVKPQLVWIVSLTVHLYHVKHYAKKRCTADKF